MNKITTYKHREILVVNVFYLVLHNNSNTNNKNCIQNNKNISCNFIKFNTNPNIKITNQNLSTIF